jgi:hypothetical protein
MKGKNVQKHPSITKINEMLNAGYNADEVSKWIKQHHQHIRYHISGVTLQAYKNNFIGMSKEDAKKKRQELLADGKTGDVNAIDSFESTRDFVEAKQRVTTELVNTLENFKSIQDKVLERINLIEAQTKDADGNPIYKPRNEEILEKYLGRLESMTNSFAKVYNDIKKQEAQGVGNTQISITMSEVNKYADVFKTIVQKILIRLDPALLNDFIAIYSDEMQKALPSDGSESGDRVNISINNGNNISIIASTSNQSEEPEAPKPQGYIEAEVKDIEEEKDNN